MSIVTILPLYLISHNFVSFSIVISLLTSEGKLAFLPLFPLLIFFPFFSYKTKQCNCDWCTKNFLFFVSSMYFELPLLTKFEILKYINLKCLMKFKQVFIWIGLLIAWFTELVDIYWLPLVDWLGWKRALRKTINWRYCIVQLIIMWLLRFPFWD